MVKDWPEQRKNQLQKLQQVLSSVEVINRTTGAITDVLKASTMAGELLYQYDDVDDKTFWDFLIEELNKDKP